jgi:hypothetical protein
LTLHTTLCSWLPDSVSTNNLYAKNRDKDPL